MPGQGHVQIRMLHKLPLLKELNEPQLHDLAEHSKLCQYAPKEIIFKEGDADDGCYIIICGMVNITTTASNGTTIPVATLGQGEFFGAIATLTGHPRIANVACATPVTLLRTTKELLLKLISLSPYIKKIVDQRYRERALRIHLKKINIFSRLKPELIEELAAKVHFKSYAKDNIIFRQGEPGDSLYLLRDGFVKLTQKGEDGKERVLAYLKEGNYFGQKALLEDTNRSSTVSAITHVDVVQIMKDDFQKLIQSDPSLEKELRETIQKREDRNVQLLKDDRMEETLKWVVDEGIIQSNAILIIDMDKCIQCDNCVKACEALHGQSRLVRKGVRLGPLLVPASCRHCEDPQCMIGCPTGAISRTRTGEIFHEEFCIGCGNCAKKCPYGNITMVEVTDDHGKRKRRAFSPLRFALRTKEEPEESVPVSTQKRKKRAVTCDMCKGYKTIACVQNCPQGAIRMVDPAKYFKEFEPIG